MKNYFKKGKGEQHSYKAWLYLIVIWLEFIEKNLIFLVFIKLWNYIIWCSLKLFYWKSCDAIFWFTNVDNIFFGVIIVSSIGSFNYKLARFLCDFLSPLVPNDYSCKDTFSLFLKLKMQIFPKNVFFLTM